MPLAGEESALEEEWPYEREHRVALRLVRVVSENLPRDCHRLAEGDRIVDVGVAEAFREVADEEVRLHAEAGQPLRLQVLRQFAAECDKSLAERCLREDGDAAPVVLDVVVVRPVVRHSVASGPVEHALRGVEVFPLAGALPLVHQRIHAVRGASVLEAARGAQHAAVQRGVARPADLVLDERVAPCLQQRLRVRSAPRVG